MGEIQAVGRSGHGATRGRGQHHKQRHAFCLCSVSSVRKKQYVNSSPVTTNRQLLFISMAANPSFLLGYKFLCTFSVLNFFNSAEF